DTAMLPSRLSLAVVCRRALHVILLAILLGLITPTAGQAQYWTAPDFSYSPAVLIQGQCYMISVPNWPGLDMILVTYTTWSGYSYFYGWPSLDSNGNAQICTDSNTVVGDYYF